MASHGHLNKNYGSETLLHTLLRTYKAPPIDLYFKTLTIKRIVFCEPGIFREITSCFTHRLIPWRKINFWNRIAHLHSIPNHIWGDDLVIVKIVQGVLGTMFLCNNIIFGNLLSSKVKIEFPKSCNTSVGYFRSYSKSWFG